jgi:Protein of unknown function (DUF1631)
LPTPEPESALIDSLHQIQAMLKIEPQAAGSQTGNRSELVQSQVGERGSPLDRVTIEIVSIVFDYIYNDERIADTIKQQLLRLQVVAIKAALIDRSFFAQRMHPMRQLLDRMTEMSVDPDADTSVDSQLSMGTAETVDWILVNFDRDLSVFEAALVQLENLAQATQAAREDWLAKQTADSEREEAVAHAQMISVQEVADRCSSNTPEFIRSFLDTVWVPVLAKSKTDLQPGIDSGRALSVVEILVWSVIPKMPEDVPRLASLLPPLISGLTGGLTMTEFSNQERERFFDQLLTAHRQAIDYAKTVTSIAQRADIPVGPIKLDAAGKLQFIAPPVETPTLSAREALATEERTLENLERGVKLEVRRMQGPYGEQTKVTHRFKLAWISPSKTLFVLSRHPAESISLTRSRMAAWLDSGKARIIDAESVVEEAIDIAAQGGTVERKEVVDTPTGTTNSGASQTTVLKTTSLQPA